jgi:hypothetical protein
MTDLIKSYQSKFPNATLQDALGRRVNWSLWSLNMNSSYGKAVLGSWYSTTPISQISPEEIAKVIMQGEGTYNAYLNWWVDLGYLRNAGIWENIWFDSSLIPLYQKYNNWKITSADYKEISAMWISAKEFATQATNRKNQPDPNIISEAQDMIKRLEIIRKWEYNPISNEFKANLNYIKNNLTLDKAMQMRSNGVTFGAMTEGERTRLESAATSLMDLQDWLFWRKSEAFKNEVDFLINSYNKIISANENASQVNNSFYWLEGVSRDELLNAILDI